jgi:hypothetical protein
MKLRNAVRAVLASALVLAILASANARAHHSFAAQYDGEKPITLSGTVAKIEWTNPHIHFYVDVKNEKGELTQWKFEGFPPNMLVRQGWKREETLKIGDAVTVFAWQARVERNLAHARTITFADGRKMTAGPPAGVGGQ